MSYVICTLVNASDEINGIKFEAHKEGKISSEKVDAEQAARFASIEGYKLVDAKPAKAKEPKAVESAKKDGEEPADPAAK